MYSLIEYSKYYRKTTRSLWNYYKDGANSSVDGATKSFDYKTNITGKLEGGNLEKENVEIAVPLKYLSNFWRTLYITL